MTIEQPTDESRELPPLLTREQYLAQLSEVDRANVLRIIDLLKNSSVLSSPFDPQDQKAGIIVFGSSAVPKELLSESPADIDLRIVLDEPVTFQQIFEMMKSIEETLVGATAGDDFDLTYDLKYSDYDRDMVVAEFKPKVQPALGIDVLLPSDFPEVGQLSKLLTKIASPNWARLKSELERANETGNFRRRDAAFKQVYLVAVA